MKRPILTVEKSRSFFEQIKYGKLLEKYCDFLENENRQLNTTTIKNSTITFAEWVDWSKYERFPTRKDLWYSKGSTFSNPLPIKTTEDLYGEFVEYLFKI